VVRRRLGRRFHPGGMRPLPRDRQALGPGRMGGIRVLRQPFALLLGAAPAPAVHPARPVGRVRA